MQQSFWLCRLVPAAVLAIVAWFLYFGFDSLNGGFAPDDMMNMYVAYAAGPGKLLEANMMFWSSVYRPLGSAFYLAMLSLFGLDPLYYHVGLLAVLTLAIPCVFFAALRLTGHRGIALLAAFLMSYNVGLNNLVFCTAFVYDALAGLFFFAALAVYLEPRQRSQPLTARRALAVCVLYICALNSKEMAVSFPVMLLLYELIMHPPEWRSRRSAAKWLRGPAAIPLAGGAITGLYIYGKTGAQGALPTLGGYQPVYTWQSYVSNNVRFLNEMFTPVRQIVTFDALSMAVLLWVLIVCAWETRRRVLWLLTAWVIVTPLPVAFLEGRGGACLYIPWFGWALILAIAAWDAIELIARARILRRLPATAVRAALACLILLAAGKNTLDAHGMHSRDWHLSGGLTMHVLEQFRKLDLRPRTDERLVFVDNPFGEWDLAFISALYWKNPKIEVKLTDKIPLSSEELARADYVIGYKDDHFIVHKRPQR